MSSKIKRKLIVIRKPHMCFGCERVFSIRRTMWIFVSKVCGKIQSNYWCPDCVMIGDDDNWYDEYYSMGSFRQNVQDLYEERGLEFQELVR